MVYIYMMPYKSAKTMKNILREVLGEDVGHSEGNRGRAREH
jgi:NMD protein affecting ribosome stability and mRNA decay